MKKMLSVILCVLMLSGMCACGGSNSNQASQTPVSPGNSTSEIEEITFSLGDVSGTGTFLEQNAQFFSQKVSELSDGKMKVEIFSDGLLGTEDALMTNIQTGALEMANFSSTFTNLVKSAGIFDFPYLVTDRDQLALLEEAGIIDMSHTLHRYGTAENLKGDYVVFAIAAQTVNAKGIHPEFVEFEKIARKYNPVNFGDMRTGNDYNVGPEMIGHPYYDNSIVHAVYTDEETVAAVLKELTEANLKLSIVVSGLLEQVAECCHKAGIGPHTVEYSMGIWGQTQRLPEEAVLSISTMCGHGMISFSLIKELANKVERGIITPKRAAEKLAGLCHCGVFNPDRAARIFEKMSV